MRLPDRAVELAEALLREARAQQTADERAQARKLARMLADPHGKDLTIALADQAFRSHRPERIADQLAYLLERYGVPQYMDWWERVALLLGGAMAHYLPSLVVPPIVARLRHETQNVILPGEEEDLRRYLEERRRAGLRLNLNQLGEAILGEAEAARRLQAYLALLARDDVEYISVKVSSVFSQIDLVAFRATVARVAERLRTLYRAAARHFVSPPRRAGHAEVHQPRHGGVPRPRPHGDGLPRGARRAGVPAAERGDRAAGLSARLAPRAARAHGVGARTAGAGRRADQAAHRQGREPGHGAHRGRGARLAPGAVRDARPRWTPTTRACSSTAAGPSTPRPCASAWRATTSSTSPTASSCARPTGSSAGSSSRCSRAWPTTRPARCASAPAASCSTRRWCGRRTSTAPSPTSSAGWTRTPRPRTFCVTSSTSSPARPAWIAERDRFLAAFDLQAGLSDAPRRTQDRSREATAAPIVPSSGAKFENDPDTDWTLAANRAWIVDVARRWSEHAPDAIPLVVDGELARGSAAGEKRDPSRPERVAYRFALAGRADVDRALTVARGAQPAWAAQPAAVRAACWRRARRSSGGGAAS